MRHRVTWKTLAASLLLGPAALATGCGATEADPTLIPSPATITEEFQGSLVQLGSIAHPFVVSATGSVTVQLTSVAPLGTMALGVAIGAWDGANCAVTNTRNDNAKIGSVALTGTAVAANYCARVYDSGNIPTDWTVTYTLRVTHP